MNNTLQVKTRKMRDFATILKRSEEKAVNFFRTLLASASMSIAALALLPGGQAAAEINLDHDGLFAELRKYTQGGSSPHRGGVYDHSAWTAMAVCEWFEKKNPWAADLSENDRKVAVIAAFMHDIGKAGDLEYALGEGAGFKPEHPNTGYEYLTGTRPFKMESGGTFDFESWRQKVGLSVDDYKIVALITRIHYDFGELVMQKWSADAGGNATRVRNFLSKLRHHAILEGAPMDERLIRIALLVSAADVKGQREVTFPCPGFAKFDGVRKPRGGGDDNFAGWGFDGEKGQKAQQLVLSGFREISGPIFYHGTKLEHAMDMVANGIKLLKPVNGSELGLGFYVSREAAVVSSYGDAYLEVTSALSDDQIRACVKLEDLTENETFNQAYLANTKQNEFNGWWTNPELIPLAFDGPYTASASWWKNVTDKSPDCVTRKSFGNQIKFNFIHNLNGKDPAFGAVVPLKGKPTIRHVCYKEIGSQEFDCQSVDDFKAKYARQWAEKKKKRAETLFDSNNKKLQCRKDDIQKIIEAEVKQAVQNQADIPTLVGEWVKVDEDCKLIAQAIAENEALIKGLEAQLTNHTFK